MFKKIFYFIYFGLVWLVERGWGEKYSKYTVNINTSLPPTDIHNSSLLYFVHVCAHVHVICSSFLYLTLEYLRNNRWF